MGTGLSDYQNQWAGGCHGKTQPSSVNLQRTRWANKKIICTFISSVPAAFGGLTEKKNHLKHIPKYVGGSGNSQQPPSNSLEAWDARALFIRSAIQPDRGLPWRSHISSLNFTSSPVDGRAGRKSFASPTPFVCIS